MPISRPTRTTYHELQRDPDARSLTVLLDTNVVVHLHTAWTDPGRLAPTTEHRLRHLLLNKTPDDGLRSPRVIFGFALAERLGRPWAPASPEQTQEWSDAVWTMLHLSQAQVLRYLDRGDAGVLRDVAAGTPPRADMGSVQSPFVELSRATLLAVLCEEAARSRTDPAGRAKAARRYVDRLRTTFPLVSAIELDLGLSFLLGTDRRLQNVMKLGPADSAADSRRKAWNAGWDLFFLRMLDADVAAPDLFGSGPISVLTDDNHLIALHDGTLERAAVETSDGRVVARPVLTDALAAAAGPEWGAIEAALEQLQSVQRLRSPSPVDPALGLAALVDGLETELSEAIARRRDGR